MSKLMMEEGKLEAHVYFYSNSKRPWFVEFFDKHGNCIKTGYYSSMSRVEAAFTRLLNDMETEVVSA